jgi:hypothetical protein
MSRRKAKSKAIIYPGFLSLHRPLLDCSDFISLKGNSIKLLVDIAQQYNGYNNGDLCASLSVMRSRGWNSNQQLSKALKELIDKNIIMLTRQGGLNMGPNLYGITWQPIDECNGKLDVKPTTLPPRSFK